MPSSITSVSLLVRIRHDVRDEEAWRIFVQRYGPRIYSWSRNRNLQASDAEDVTQDVLTKLAKNLGSFQYDASGSFRGWLRRVTENTISDFFRERENRASRDRDIAQLLDNVEAKADLEQRLAAAFDIELLDLAKMRVKAMVDKDRWMAWEMTAEQQRSGEDVSRELGIKVATVYSIRSKVQAMIADEVQKLEQGSPSDAFSFRSDQDH